jgi:type VI secretion system protein ImpF
MARPDAEMRVTLSVLDRLLDYEPELSREPPASRGKSLREMKQAVRRDLEMLLNTRRSGDLPEGAKELETSVIAYGLPDYSSVNVNIPSEQNAMRRALENAIRTFEPRLGGVTVTLEPTREHERALHFRIDAHLLVDPAPEPVTFDTTLQLTTGEYEVQGD